MRHSRENGNSEYQSIGTFISGLMHLNMNSYPRLTCFKYEIALNCVSPIPNWRKSLPPLRGGRSSARRGRRRCDCPFPLWGKVRMGAKMPAHRRLNRTNAIFSSGLTRLNMNSYLRLTRFKYEIALNCVSPKEISNCYAAAPSACGTAPS